ncbi:MAG: DUF2892 domain-containing protein [Bacteroidales bacterium]|nr:DUF2892 domain-containing protein [Bacteroidales bacterium]
MKCNVGKTDKIIRIVLGLAIGAAGLYFNSWWGLLALIPLGTALFGRCALYAPFGISTAKKE